MVPKPIPPANNTTGRCSQGWEGNRPEATSRSRKVQRGRVRGEGGGGRGRYQSAAGSRPSYQVLFSRHTNVGPLCICQNPVRLPCPEALLVSQGHVCSLPQVASAPITSPLTITLRQLWGQKSQPPSPCFSPQTASLSSH